MGLLLCEPKANRPVQGTQPADQISGHHGAEQSHRRISALPEVSAEQCAEGTLLRFQGHLSFAVGPQTDTPSAIAIARERWHSMLHCQSERDKRVVRLRMSGAIYVEIGNQLGLDERTVRQVISDLVGVA